MSRTNSGERQAVTVVRVHVGLNLENKTREGAFECTFIFGEVEARYRRGSKFGNCIKECANTKVGES
jgi:hypothetical protein